MHHTVHIICYRRFGIVFSLIVRSAVVSYYENISIHVRACFRLSDISCLITLWIRKWRTARENVHIIRICGSRQKTYNFICIPPERFLQLMNDCAVRHYLEFSITYSYFHLLQKILQFGCHLVDYVIEYYKPYGARLWPSEICCSCCSSGITVLVIVVVVVSGPAHDATFKKTSSLRQSANFAASFSSSTNGFVSSRAVVRVVGKFCGEWFPAAMYCLTFKHVMWGVWVA